MYNIITKHAQLLECNNIEGQCRCDHVYMVYTYKGKVCS